MVKNVTEYSPEYSPQSAALSRAMIDLVVRPREPPLGAGEASATPVPAALANAIFDATGARLRTVPFTRQRVLSALA